MSTRHRAHRRSGPTSAVPEERERRKAEHRRLRRTVNQQLHVALGDDHDGLVLEDPHPTHGYTDEHDTPDARATGRPPRRVRHWKQPFWKRRTLERRRRAQAWTELAEA